MADTTAFTPPNHGLSELLKESVEPYSPQGPENVKNNNMKRRFVAATRHNDCS